MRRTTQLAALCLFVFLAATAARAETYLSRWDNTTNCSYVIHNDATIVLGAHGSHDFGNTGKDPNSLLGGKIDYITQSCSEGPVPFKLVQSTGFARKKCAGIDPGPFKITTSYKDGAPSPSIATASARSRSATSTSGSKATRSCSPTLPVPTPAPTERTPRRR